MKIAIPNEVSRGERRVAIVPAAVAGLRGAGLEVTIESGAGVRSHFQDAEYQQAGASVVASREQLLREGDVVAKVQQPNDEEVALLRDGTVLLSYLQPLAHLKLVRTLATKRISAFSMDLIPRVSRAQSMDALSSQATASGYKA